MDFGWFYFLTKPIFYCLDWLNGLLGNFGLAILVFTVFAKALFFPLANYSYRSMSKMKLLAPKMTALRERFKDEPQRMQQEMMAMYRAEKVNPASGCLPMVVQIPVFFSLYKVIFVTIEMRHAPFFGWIHDLSAVDPTNIFNLFGLIPFDPATLSPWLHLGAWPIIMGGTMWLQMRLNPPPPDPVQARMFQFMPLIFTFMLASFPAGLVIYWSWNNLLSIAQQWLIMRRTQPGAAGACAHLTDDDAELIEAGRLLFAAECRFVYAAQRLDQLPPPAGPEVAFAGRSNVGKSSLLNALTGRHALARVSGEPGRTRQLNFFDLGGRLDAGGYARLRLCARRTRGEAGLAGDDVRLPARAGDTAAGDAAAGRADRGEGGGCRGDGAARSRGGDVPACVDQGRWGEAGGAGAKAGGGAGIGARASGGASGRGGQQQRDRGGDCGAAGGDRGVGGVRKPRMTRKHPKGGDTMTKAVELRFLRA